MEIIDAVPEMNRCRKVIFHLSYYYYYFLILKEEEEEEGNDCELALGGSTLIIRYSTDVGKRKKVLHKSGLDVGGY